MGWRLLFAALVIAAVAVVIIAVVAAPMPVQLHVPLEGGSTLITGKHAGGKVASFDVRDQRWFARQACITDVTEEFACDFWLVGDGSG